VNEIEGTRRTFTGYALMALQKEELYLRLFNELISLLANRPELMFTNSDSKHWIYTLSEEVLTHD